MPFDFISSSVSVLQGFVQGITGFIRFSDFPQRLAGNADRHNAAWNRFFHNASGADYAAVAYGDAGADGDAGAEPAVVADFNGFGVA